MTKVGIETEPRESLTFGSEEAGGRIGTEQSMSSQKRTSVGSGTSREGKWRTKLGSEGRCQWQIEFILRHNFWVGDQFICQQGILSGVGLLEVLEAGSLVYSTSTD